MTRFQEAIIDANFRTENVCKTYLQMQRKKYEEQDVFNLPTEERVKYVEPELENAIKLIKRWIPDCFELLYGDENYDHLRSIVDGFFYIDRSALASILNNK